MPTLRARTLARAAFIAGGIESLADRLSIKSAVLSLYIQGQAPVPEDIFFGASEILTEAGVSDAAKPAPGQNDAKRHPT